MARDTIVDVQTFLIAPRWLLVRITTASGLVGWGEGTLEGRSATVATEVRDLRHFLLGQNSDNIAKIHHAIATQPFYHTDAVLRSALAGIDIALWDIKGKRHGVPIYQLLGGLVNHTVRCYRWFGGNVPQCNDIDGQESAVRMLQRLLEGRDPNEWSYFKMNALPGCTPMDTDGAIVHAREVLRSIRDAFAGRRVRIGIDCHGRLQSASARQFLAMAEEFADLLLFVEEPLAVEVIEQMPQLRQATKLRLATGERLYTVNDFTRICNLGCADILQPDLGHCGGITAGRQIAEIAASHQLAFAPHCPNGPVLLAASLHVQGYTPACGLQETSVGIHYNAGRDATWYLRDPHTLIPDNRGFLAIPSGPGLGIDIDEEKVRQAAEVGVTWDEASCFLHDRVGGCPLAW